MASQNESDTKSGNDDANELHSRSRHSDSDGSQLESKGREPEPFSNEDPLLPVRIGQAVGEATSFLSEVQIEGIVPEGTTNREFKTLFNDAVERKSWSQARQDGFVSILRLARPIPSRANRIL